MSESVDRDYLDDPNFVLRFVNKKSTERVMELVTKIKEAFKKAGLDRIVTVLDQQTRQEVQKPLYEVASSHMARRTFIGNIYKKVKDPNLVGSLSGHKEGSKAFARYRDIDEDMKRELIKFLD